MYLIYSLLLMFGVGAGLWMLAALGAFIMNELYPNDVDWKDGPNL